MMVKEMLFDYCVNFMYGDALGLFREKTFIVDYGIGHFDGAFFRYTDLQETYRLQNGVFEQIETGTEADNGEGFCREFKEGIIKIGVMEDGKNAYFSFILGSLFGRGFRMEIEKDENGNPVLGEEKLLWLS